MAHRTSETDRTIIQHLRGNARMSNAELAGKVHLSEAQCLRRLRALERARIIRQYTAIINLSAADLPIMGIIEVRVGSPSKSGIVPFESTMSQMESITACWHMSGDANYVVTASVRTPPEYDRVLSDLAAIEGVSIIRSLLVLQAVKPTAQSAPDGSPPAEAQWRSQLPPGGMSPRTPQDAHARAANATRRAAPRRLDDFDRRILGILSDNSRIHNTEIARRIGLSPAPCLRRVRALERAGIIQRYVAVVDTDALGLVVAIVHVRFERENPQVRRLFEQRLLEAPQIGTVFRTNGESDYVLVAEVPGLDHLDRLVLGSLLPQPGVKSVQSAIRLRDCLHHTSRLRGVVLPAHEGRSPR